MAPSSIPSPSSGTISIGPLDLTAYGLAIALGVIAAVWLTGRRFEQKGIGTRDDVGSIAIGAVIAGVVGARLYHVATDWEKFQDNLGDIPKIWEGGLGIPGGMFLGVVVGVVLVRRRGIPAGIAANCAAPALPLAQAIGRWGNYFNQELYGSPTGLPWALEIDDRNLEPGYASGTTFHPTFLYESIWNLALCAALLLVDRRFTVRPWQLLAMYVTGYGVGRFWIEGLRIDEAKELAGLRLNQWMAVILIVAGLAYLAWSALRPAAETAAGGVSEPHDDEVHASPAGALTDHDDGAAVEALGADAPGAHADDDADATPPGGSSREALEGDDPDGRLRR